MNTYLSPVCRDVRCFTHILKFFFLFFCVETCLHYFLFARLCVMKFAFFFFLFPSMKYLFPSCDCDRWSVYPTPVSLLTFERLVVLTPKGGGE